jgi:DNA-binding NtrC family response regulator
MKIRALVFEDEPNLRELLVRILERRGYEVFAFEHPDLCPLHNTDTCVEACADLMISDLRMPNMSGLDFLEKQTRLGCKVRNVALMSGAWDLSEINRAHELGYSVFNKPFSVKDLSAWLEECEKTVEPGRVLSDIFASKTT